MGFNSRLGNIRVGGGNSDKQKNDNIYNWIL